MSVGRTGIGQDIGDLSVFTSWNNRFQHNTYRLGASTKHFEWMNGTWSKIEGRVMGQVAGHLHSIS
jgi:hypothetical protein